MPHGQVSGKFHRGFAAGGPRGRRRRRCGAGVHQSLDGRSQVIGSEVGIPLDDALVEPTTLAPIHVGVSFVSPLPKEGSVYAARADLLWSLRTMKLRLGNSYRSRERTTRRRDTSFRASRRTRCPSVASPCARRIELSEKW